MPYRFAFRLDVIIMRLLLCIFPILLYSCNNAKSMNSSLEVISVDVWLLKEAQMITKSLSISQKASQILMTRIDGKETFAGYLKNHYKDCVPGGILLFRYNIADSPVKVRKFLESSSDSLMQLGTDIPVLFAIDHEGGDVYRMGSVTTRLPSAQEVSLHLSEAQAGSLYYHSARQLKLLGIDMNLAPVAEMQNYSPDSFMASRFFSPDPVISSGYASASVLAHTAASTIAVVKHFPGSGSSDPHHSVPYVSGSRDEIFASLDKLYLPLFSSGVDAVLVSHASIPDIDPGIPFCLSFPGVSGVLRDRYKFDGLILTDDISMEAIRTLGYSSSQAAILALAAGCDMILTSDTDLRTISDSVRSWAESDPANLHRLDQAVSRIIRLKLKTGLVPTSLGKYYRSRNSFENPRDFNFQAFKYEKEQGDCIVENLYGK